MMNKTKLVPTIVVAACWLALAAISQAATDKPQVVALLGDSLTVGTNWSVRLPGVQAINFGHSGDNTTQLLARLEPVIAAQPDVVFIQGGINDSGATSKFETTLANHLAIWSELKTKLPQARFYVISLLPVSESRYPGWNQAIGQFNQILKAEAQREGLVFVDLFPHLIDEEGQLRADYTYDGLHLKSPAYEIWAETIKTLLSAK